MNAFKDLHEEVRRIFSCGLLRATRVYPRRRRLARSCQICVLTRRGSKVPGAFLRLPLFLPRSLNEQCHCAFWLGSFFKLSFFVLKNALWVYFLLLSWLFSAFSSKRGELYVKNCTSRTVHALKMRNLYVQFNSVYVGFLNKCSSGIKKTNL